MQTLDQLNEAFALHDHLSFHQDQPGMVQARIVSRGCDATVYLQGAHLTRWNPRGTAPVFYLSPSSHLQPGRPIRGGIPVLFPWFGERWNGAEHLAATGIASPMHGFARTSVWTVTRTHLSPAGEVHLTLTLGPSDLSRSMGYDHFTATLEFRMGHALHVALTVTNHGTTPMVFEEGLHSYFAVGDVHAFKLGGLRGSTYFDKRDHDIRKVQRETLFQFTRDVDQVHVHTAEPLTLHDPGNVRTLTVAKTGLNTTVIWNPWDVLTPGIPDLPPDAWQHFVCVEVVNAADDRMNLAPGASYGMAMDIEFAGDAPTSI